MPSEAKKLRLSALDFGGTCDRRLSVIKKTASLHTRSRFYLGTNPIVLCVIVLCHARKPFEHRDNKRIDLFITAMTTGNVRNHADHGLLP